MLLEIAAVSVQSFAGGLETSLKFGGGSGHPMNKLLLVSLLNLFVFRGLFIFQKR